MTLIGVQILNDFKAKHADIGPSIDSLVQEIEEGNWSTPHELKEWYPSADFLGNRRVVLNIKGNNYRLVIQVDYRRRAVLIRKIGTHSEYNKWKLK